MNAYEQMKETVLSFLMNEVENLFIDEAYLFEVEDVINWHIENAPNEETGDLNFTSMINQLRLLDEKYFDEVLFRKVLNS